MKQVSDDVAVLTAKYGGLLWGEHSRGFRAEYSSAFFDGVLYDKLRRIRTVFDPDNCLNPGEIYPPEGVNAPMIEVDVVKHGI